LIVQKHYLLEFNWYRAITQCTHPVNVLTTKLGIKIVRKRIPTWRSVAFLQLWPNGWMDQDATCERGRPRSRPHCVRWGPIPPLQPLPTFGPCLLWLNGHHLSNCWALVLHTKSRDCRGERLWMMCYCVGWDVNPCSLTHF